MLGVITKKKWLFIGVVLISVVLIIIMHSAVTSKRERLKNEYHFKLAAKPHRHKNYNFDEHFDESLAHDFSQSLGLETNDNQDFLFKPSLATDTSKFIKNSSLVDKLADVLGYKLATLTTQERKLRPVCHNPNVIANSCDDGGCLRTSISTGLKERLDELVTPQHLKVSPKIQSVLDNMVKNIPNRVQFTLVTAASSNHFLEVQSLIHNVHQNIFPHFKNFTFVFYNIGLTAEERDQTAKFCKCHIVDFPFHEFPDFVNNLKCFSWKPIIINAHINKADIILWADSSIRFDTDPNYLSALFERVEKRTIQLGTTQVISPFRSYRSMYHFFGDEPCMYLDMFQAQGSVSVFKSEFFVKRAVLDPLVACALSQTCICPVKQKETCKESRKMVENWEARKGPIVYGLCSRFDQSAISQILHKLYQGYFHWVNFHIASYVQIKRNDKLAYFDSLEKRK